MGAWAACGTNGPSAHPERGRPGCGQPEVGSARPGQQPGVAAKTMNAARAKTTCVSADRIALPKHVHRFILTSSRKGWNM